MGWLAETPIALVRACHEQMPRLQAQESLREVDRIALGSGMVKKRDARRALRKLERLANRGARRRTQRPKSPEDLAAVGIGVKFVGADDG